MNQTTTLECDVLVVGYGGAGVCAAIEAAESGASVLALERFVGGGATRASGGVVYAGGGTATQRAAGIDDSVESMVAYLRREGRGQSDEEHLRLFCERSCEDLDWLKRQGLRFPAKVFFDKTVVPPAGVGLYYSGNEKPGAPRGHVPEGHGQRGALLFDTLAAAAEGKGVRVRRHCRVTRLLAEESGRVIGVEALQVRAPLLHNVLGRVGALSRTGTRLLRGFEPLAASRLRVLTRRGVILACGGFVFNSAMMAAHAPGLLGAMPLGTPGDDGAGIAMALEVGAATACMDRCAAWRFLYPPRAFLRGLLVNRRGERFCDESLYGATVGRAISEQPGGRAWLILDGAGTRTVRTEAAADERIGERCLGEILAGQANDLIFRKWSTWANLHVNRKRAKSLEGLERACRLPEGSLQRSIAEHNARLASGQADPWGKPAEFRAPIGEPPFLAVACELDSKLFLGPCLTLGGLVTDPKNAQVLGEDGAPVPGLYAAGRTAVGVATGGYVSGLSVADCVFSGRNAGRHAAAGRSSPS